MDQNMNMNEEKKPFGAMISIVVIVAVLAFGAYHFLKQVPPVAEETTETPTSTVEQTDTTVSALSTQGTSTDLADIQKDLNATDLSGLETGLGSITL